MMPPELTDTAAVQMKPAAPFRLDVYVTTGGALFGAFAIKVEKRTNQHYVCSCGNINNWWTRLANFHDVLHLGPLLKSVRTFQSDNKDGQYTRRPTCVCT